MLRGDALYKHIRLRSDNRRVDEAKEEEAADQGAYSVICRVRILPLHIGRNEAKRDGKRR